MELFVLILVFVGWFMMFVTLSLVHILMVPPEIRNQRQKPKTDPNAIAALHKEKEPQT